MADNLISVIDDDASVCRSTTFLIEAFGYRAAAFESAERFLSSGQRHHTACLLLDLHLPGMNGLQLQSRLAEEGYSIPVIFMTAHDDKEARHKAMQAGAVAFLVKPFNDEQLLQTIRSVLGRDDGGSNRSRKAT